ncbi:MAG: hypothetical protein P8179_04955 [Candidatus Thiodiazotropha sp.]
MQNIELQNSWGVVFAENLKAPRRPSEEIYLLSEYIDQKETILNGHHGAMGVIRPREP